MRRHAIHLLSTSICHTVLGLKELLSVRSLYVLHLHRHTMCVDRLLVVNGLAILIHVHGLLRHVVLLGRYGPRGRVLAPPGGTPAGIPAGVVPAGVVPAGVVPAGADPAGADPAGAAPVGTTPGAGMN